LGLVMSMFGCGSVSLQMVVEALSRSDRVVRRTVSCTIGDVVYL
jgi:hypothetical protein